MMVHKSPPRITANHPQFVRTCLVACSLVLIGWGYVQAYKVWRGAVLSMLVPWHHGGTVVRSSQLTGDGQIYLVQVGPHNAPYTVVGFAAWLREKYSLSTQVLPALPLEDSTYDSSRHSYVAERINDQIKRNHPELAANPKVFIIGFTDAPMYSATEHYNYTFSQRDTKRAAIISAHELQEFRFGEDSVMESLAFRLTSRLRRILLKDVAVLFWHLPLNHDPGSVLYFSLNPYLPGSDLYQTDLDPLHSRWGLYIQDPCIVFTHVTGSALTPTTPLIQQCQKPESSLTPQVSLLSLDLPPDTSQERIELRLAYGLLTAKHTDFLLPGPVPIRFERAFSNQWEMPSAFGLSGSHNYDRYLVTHDSMHHITIGNAGSGDAGLVRRPYWLPFLPFNKWTDSDTSGSALTLRWMARPQGHFDLRRYNGEVESYLPCTDAELCYLNGYQNPAGQRLTVTRDAQRNLIGLSAPGNNWLRFTHADLQSAIRVTSILDSHGRSVHYTYNSSGQLAAVAYPSSGETITYAWDNSQNLVRVAAALPGGAPVTFITNQYDRGHLIAQTLADGSTFRYAFLTADGMTSRIAQVTAPDGTFYELVFGTGAAIYARQPHGGKTSATNGRYTETTYRMHANR